MHLMKKMTGLLIAAALLAAVLPAAGSAGEDIHVVILATSDIHGNLWGYSYENDTETENSGMARLYTYISQVRAENPTVFLVDGGDELQGTIITDQIANREPEKEHPVMTAMNDMGYDAMTLGNHEFDWGVETLKTILSQAAFPVLGANVLDRDGGYLTGSGWTILERNGIRLAVIGVCTPDVPVWDHDREGVADTTFEAAAPAVKKAIAEIGDRADIILVSVHMGQYAEYDVDGQSDAGEAIAAENPEVDILQLAHMHITVNDRIGKVPAVGVRNAGREIARIDVILDGEKQIKDISTQIIDMDGFAPGGEIREIPVVKETHEEAIRLVRAGLAEQETDADGDAEKVLGTAAAAFQPENEIRGLPEWKLRDTALMDLILKVQMLSSGADVTVASLPSDTSDLPAGTMRYGDIAGIYPFDNMLVKVQMTGAELKKYMESAAAGYNTWQPGDINISFDPEYPGYLLDQFSGVEYEINLSRPRGERIEHVTVRGEPLRDDQELMLAVSSYRYASCLRQNHLAGGNATRVSTEMIRDMIAEYVAAHSPLEPVTDHNWRITGVDLREGDPRREEIIGWINEGLLPAPYNRSYNLADYEALAREAEANREAGRKVN